MRSPTRPPQLPEPPLLCLYSSGHSSRLVGHQSETARSHRAVAKHGYSNLSSFNPRCGPGKDHELLVFVRFFFWMKPQISSH